MITHCPYHQHDKKNNSYREKVTANSFVINMRGEQAVHSFFRISYHCCLCARTTCRWMASVHLLLSSKPYVHRLFLRLTDFLQKQYTHSPCKNQSSARFRINPGLPMLLLFHLFLLLPSFRVHNQNLLRLLAHKRS